MIKILIKYRVFEYAIETFFNKVSNNFTNVNMYKFEKGQTYSKIVTMYTECGIKYKSIYYDCIVVNTNNTECILISYAKSYITEYKSDIEYSTHHDYFARNIIYITEVAIINV